MNCLFLKPLNFTKYSRLNIKHCCITHHATLQQHTFYATCEAHPWYLHEVLPNEKQPRRLKCLVMVIPRRKVCFLIQGANLLPFQYVTCHVFEQYLYKRSCCVCKATRLRVSINTNVVHSSQQEAASSILFKEKYALSLGVLNASYFYVSIGELFLRVCRTQ